MLERLMGLIGGLKTVSPADLHRMVQDGAVTAIDVNAPERWTTARVPGAWNLDPYGFREGDLPADRDAALVFYCSNFMCQKAPNAARRAEGMGWRDVRVMSAGIKGWLDAGLPTESGAREA